MSSDREKHELSMDEARKNITYLLGELIKKVESGTVRHWEFQAKNHVEEYNGEFGRIIRTPTGEMTFNLSLTIIGGKS